MTAHHLSLVLLLRATRHAASTLGFGIAAGKRAVRVDEANQTIEALRLQHDRQASAPGNLSHVTPVALHVISSVPPMAAIVMRMGVGWQYDLCAVLGR